MQIVLATANKHKVDEINKISKDSGIEFILPQGGFDVIENGATFEENSKIKALAAWEISHAWTLADDSGLCIDALGGKPGIYSARYADTPQNRINRVLKELEGVQNRKARFVCAMTLVSPQGDIAYACKGTCEGSIAEEQFGANGFGYDPIFTLNGTNKTMAELSDYEKNQISHRANALKQVISYIEDVILANQ